MYCFRSPQANQDLSGVSVGVGNNIIQQSSKVRDLGVIFYLLLSFDYHSCSVYWSTHFYLRNIRGIRYDASAQLIHIYWLNAEERSVYKILSSSLRLL